MNTTSTVTIKDPKAAATLPQISYLKSLMDNRDNDTVINQARYALACNALTKGMASSFIDKLKASPVKAKAPVYAYNLPASTEKAVETFTPAQPAQLPTPAFGYYQIPDIYKAGSEALYCFDSFKVGGSSKVKLMKLKHTEVYDYKLGKYVPKGKWAYAGSSYTAKKLLAGAAPITVKQAAEIGKLVGFCIRCGRTLTDPESVANGIGPICASYVGWGV